MKTFTNEMNTMMISAMVKNQGKYGRVTSLEVNEADVVGGRNQINELSIVTDLKQLNRRRKQTN